MKLSSTLLPLACLLTPSAPGQVSVEGFEGGNPDGWELWFSPYNALLASGGNPGACLELDNFNQGPATCHFVEMFPAGAAGSTAYAHSGDWRAAGVTDVTVDLDVQEGLFVGDVRIELVSDPGTPTNSADDCIASLNLPAAGAAGAGWNTYAFPVPSGDTTFPTGWEFDTASPCSSGNLDAAWNALIQDVDQIRFVYDGFPPAFCNFTSWVLRLDNIAVNGAGTPQLGTNYCSAEVNSTGVAAAIEGAGSAIVTDNDVTLTCANMPDGSFAFFFTSQTQDFFSFPGGSMGNLCLGGNIGRYVGPGEIQNSGTAGQVSLALDLNQHPTPGGFVQVAAGETWNFSCWFRDTTAMGTATSNFADGFSISFQ